VFFKSSTWALRLTQRPNEWLRGFFVETDLNNSYPLSVEVKNVWSYNSIPSICLHGVDRDYLTFNFIVFSVTNCVLISYILTENRPVSQQNTRYKCVETKVFFGPIPPPRYNPQTVNSPLRTDRAYQASTLVFRNSLQSN
jgi:hypothetical protein